MKKRLIALFLCSALIFGMVPTVLAEALGNDKLYINYNGETVSTVSYAMSKDAPTIKLDAMLAESASGTYQWQLRVPAGGKWTSMWIDLPGMNGASASLSYGMVGQFMVDGKAQVRVTFTQGNNTLTSDEVSLSFTQEAPETEEKEAAKPEVIAPGSVDNVTIQAPSETPKTETPKADETPAQDETPKTEEPQDEEPKTDDTPAEDETPSQGDETPAGDETLKDKIEGAIEGIVGAITGSTTLDDADKAVGSDTPASQETPTTKDTTPDVKKTFNIVINYKFENNEIVSDPYTANLAEGSSFSATVTFPTVQGYLPYVNDVQQNGIELNYASISEDVTINVVYKPTNVNYTVIHYQQNVENDSYTIESTETKQGLTGSTVPEVAKTYEGFYNLLYERPAIAADGSTVIEVYYDRYYYLMNFALNGGYGTEPVYARYGAPIGTVTNPTKKGYTFQGWSLTKPTGNVGEVITTVTLPTTMPAESRTYYAVWKGDDKVAMTVVIWGENADDDGYTYMESKVILVDPDTGFSYDQTGGVICAIEEHTHTDYTDECYKLTCTTPVHTHTDACLSCAHTAHTTDCYSVGSGTGFRYLTETTQPSATLTDAGNGIYTYTTGNGYNKETHYYVKIGDQWYTGKGAISGTKDTYRITFNCSHTHTDACYSCGQTVHTHSSSCYTLTCTKTEHTHTSACSTALPNMDSTKWVLNTEKSESTDKAEYDGSTVVNIYYDRVEYSVRFYKKDNNYTEYTDLKITAKWGAHIGDSWPSVDGSSDWYVNKTGSTCQANLLVMPVGGDEFYGPRTSRNTSSAKYYVEILDGEEWVTTKGNVNYKLHHTDTAQESGLSVTEDDMYGIDGFTINKEYSTSTGSSYSNASFYYTRNSYGLVFNNGERNIKTETVKYQAPLGQYDFTPTEVPSKYEPGSVKFDGWYLNPECTGEQYILANHTMPAGAENGDNALVLYAKWVPVTRTVKFFLTENHKEVYTPSGAEQASFTVPHASTLDEEYVKNHLEKSAMNEAKPNGDYTFVMWYYYENGVKKPFDPSMAITKDLTLYGEWSFNTLKEYTVQYVLQSDHSVKVADDLTGSGLAGTTKTFDAKGGTDLYAAYQEGYFPTVQSQSLLLDIDEETLTITFEYVPKPAVPYTVKYVEKDTGKSLAEDKYVEDNRKAVVTETFKPISGYMPDAYQKRLVVKAEGENILYFYYTKDTEHAYYKITHYTQNTDGATWAVHAESQAIGDIGTRYTAAPMTIPGYTYKETKYVVNGTEVTDVTAEGAKLTENGLEINLYYVRNEYPYQVRYLEQGSGTVLHAPKNGTGKYGQVISESAIDIDGYDKVDPTSATITIKIEQNETPGLNIITFYYKEQEVTINYVAVGPEGATNFGSVTPTTETVKVKSGTAQGSTPTAGDGFKFVGWYTDDACTNAVNPEWVVTDNKIVPAKQDGKNVPNTYYAKFEYDITSLTIQKKISGTQYDSKEMFIFTVVGEGVNQRVVVPAGGSITINGLKVGAKYTITEDDSWSWRYTTASENNPITLTATAESNVVVFTNTLDKDNWLTGDSSAKNLFTGKTES